MCAYVRYVTLLSSTHLLYVIHIQFIDTINDTIYLSILFLTSFEQYICNLRLVIKICRLPASTPSWTRIRVRESDWAKQSGILISTCIYIIRIPLHFPWLLHIFASVFAKVMCISSWRFYSIFLFWISKLMSTYSRILDRLYIHIIYFLIYHIKENYQISSLAVQQGRSQTFGRWGAKGGQ